MRNLFKHTYFILGLTIIPYILAYFFPNIFWSINSFVFLSKIQKTVLSTSILLSLGLTLYLKKITFSFNNYQKIFISISSIALFIFLAQKSCYYGDAYKFNKYLNKIPTQVPLEATQKLFSISLNAWSGEGTILALITYVAYLFKISYKTAFIIFDAFWGGLFIYIWTTGIQYFVKNSKWKLTLFIMGISAPFLLVFMGHIEIYAPIITINLLWLLLSLIYLKTQKSYWLLIAIFTWLIAIKLHTTALLGGVGLIFLILQKTTHYTLSWKQIGGYLIAPLYFIGGLLYFFYFKDYNDDRSIQKTILAYDHLFLPVVSPTPPLNKYNLLSINHILDFVSIFFIWSPLAVFLLLYIVFKFKNKINWNTIQLKFIGTILLFYVSLFFMINPLLSLPIDWDLFSIPASFLFILILVLVSEIEHEYENKRLIGISFIFAFLSLPFFIIHQSKKQTSLKLESIAYHIYQTYYEWTAHTFENALTTADISVNEKIDRRDLFLKKLAPYAKKDIDYEYRTILNTQGKTYLRDKNNPKKALEYFKKSYSYSPSNNTQILAIEAYFKLKDYQNAYLITQELIAKKFPSEKKALNMAIHISLAAKKYNNALILSKTYLKKYKSPVVNEIYHRITNNNEITSLIKLFAPKNNH